MPSRSTSFKKCPERMCPRPMLRACSYKLEVDIQQIDAILYITVRAKGNKMTQLKLQSLQQDLERCGIHPTIVQVPFSEWKNLPRQHGLYSIWQGNQCIYVGQAGGKEGFKGRFLHHWNKAWGIEYSSTSHGKAWVAARLTESWAPDTWTVEYFCCERATHRTYLEGAMMLMFDPLCNDETFADRG